MEELKIKAPAKINLHLEVLRKRDDDFHDISSIFTLIDLYDSLISDSHPITNAMPSPDLASLWDQKVEDQRASIVHPTDQKIFKRTGYTLPQEQNLNRSTHLQPKTHPCGVTGTADGLASCAFTRQQPARTVATDPGQPRTALNPDVVVAASKTGST